MGNEKRIKFRTVKCPTCKLTLLVKPGVNFCPAWRGSLTAREGFDRILDLVLE